MEVADDDEEEQKPLLYDFIKMLLAFIALECVEMLPRSSVLQHSSDTEVFLNLY